MGTKIILRTWAALRSVGPYLLIELVLPGGTLFALALWLSQRFGKRKETAPGTPAKPLGAGTPAVVAPAPALGSIKPLGVALR